MFRELGNRYGQAEVLNYLGEVLSRSADSHQARDQHSVAPVEGVGGSEV